jgi:hypothetical protein
MRPDALESLQRQCLRVELAATFDGIDSVVRVCKAKWVRNFSITGYCMTAAVKLSSPPP